MYLIYRTLLLFHDEKVLAIFVDRFVTAKSFSVNISVQSSVDTVDSVHLRV